MNQKFVDKEMAEFEEAFPNYRYLNDAGAKRLAAAIIALAARDYYDVCDNPDNVRPRQSDDMTVSLRTKASLERFIKSSLYEMLCDIPPDRFIRKIKELKQKNKRFPNAGSFGITAYGPQEVSFPVIKAGGNHKHVRHVYGDFL